MTAEPRWDRDLAYGKQGELLIENYLEWIARGNGRVETKRKRRPDLWFYVETYCDKGATGHPEPSGINITKAEAWAYVIGNTDIALIIPTETLRKACEQEVAQQKQERNGSCPTQGVLVHLNTILTVGKER